MNESRILLNEIRETIATISQELRGGYQGRAPEVLELIKQTREALVQADGLHSIWERIELEYAEWAARANWLTLAVAAIDKALCVNALSDDEYWAGYSYTHPRTQREPRKWRR